MDEVYLSFFFPLAALEGTQSMGGFSSANMQAKELVDLSQKQFGNSLPLQTLSKDGRSQKMYSQAPLALSVIGGSNGGESMSRTSNNCHWSV